jgi:TP901-1 family phage major tail protein
LVAQKGRLLLIEVEQTPGEGDFIPLGGLRTKSLKINNEAVDVTSDDDEGYRKLLEGAGINSIEGNGAGIISDAQGFDIAREAAEDNVHINMRVTIPGSTYSRVYEGLWQITECEMSGEYKDSAQYKMTFASDGEITKSRIGG